MKIPVFWWELAFSLVCLSLAASAASAQKADWQAIEILKSGTVVSVKTRHRYLCTLDHATSDTFVCQSCSHRIVPIPMPPGFSRNEIREIRLEHNQSKDAWIGAGVGAVAGISLGASSNSASRGAGAFFGGIGGGLAGALLGGAGPIFHHKQVIYQR